MRKIKVRPCKVREKWLWCVDLRILGKGRHFFNEEPLAIQFAWETEQEIWECGASNALTPSQKLEAIEAFRDLPSGYSLGDAARIIRDHFQEKSRLSVPQAVAKFIAFKESEHLSFEYIRTLKIRMNRFLLDFSGDFSEITLARLESWKSNLIGAPKTKKNICSCVQLFLRWAQDQGFIHENFKGLRILKVRVPPKGNIEILHPDELKRILRVCPKSRIAALVIAAFAGLRTAEIQRLEWQHIKDDYIVVGAEASKVRKRRLVLIPQNLKSWLECYREFGPVVKTRSGNYYHQIAKAAGFKWRRNCLRHSWFSYKVALTQDVAAVAYEGGNSPGMIYSNYREVVRPSQAESWFAIGPMFEIEDKIRIVE